MLQRLINVLEALNTFSHLSNVVYIEGKCLCLPHKYLFCKHGKGTKSCKTKQKGKFSSRVLEISEIAEITESGQLQNFNNKKV